MGCPDLFNDWGHVRPVFVNNGNHLLTKGNRARCGFKANRNMAPVDSPFKHPFAFTSRNADNGCSVKLSLYSGGKGTMAGVRALVLLDTRAEITVRLPLAPRFDILLWGTANGCRLAKAHRRDCQGEASSGAASDLKEASRLALSMVATLRNLSTILRRPTWKITLAPPREYILEADSRKATRRVGRT
jgi:hypothetical protein